MDKSYLIRNVTHMASIPFRDYVRSRLAAVDSSLRDENIRAMWPGDPTLQALHRGALQMEKAQWERTMEISDYCLRKLEYTGQI